MRSVHVAVRVARYLARRPGARGAALRVGLGLLAGAMVWRTCAHGPRAAEQSPPPEARATPRIPAFCKRFDPNEIYLWGETLEGSTYTRAIAELAAPDVYCQLPSRSTFMPSIRADRRLMFIRDFGHDGERAYRYEAGGGDGEREPTPNCVTRFRWLRDSQRHLHYGCEVRDPYEKEWIPVFYRDAAVLIGSGKGLQDVLGEPSDGSVVAVTRDGLVVVDIGTNEVKPITGLPRVPRIVRATRQGFLALTENVAGDDARLWRIDRSGASTPDGALAALPDKSDHTAVAMTSDGEVYEYLRARPDAEDPTNTIVVRTRTATRTVHSDAEWKKRGRPFVRLDTKSKWGAGVVTSR